MGNKRQALENSVLKYQQWGQKTKHFDTTQEFLPHDQQADLKQSVG